MTSLRAAIASYILVAVATFSAGEEGSVASPRSPTRSSASAEPTIANGLIEADPAHDQSVPLTLADLESLALANNPTLAQSVARVDAAQGDFIQRGLYPNPQFGYTGTEMGNEGRAGQQGLFVGQTIVTGGKLRLARAAASQEVRRTEWLYQAQGLRVLNDVRVGYFELLFARRAMELQGELLRVAQEGLKAAEALFQAKETSRVDTLQAKVEAEGIAIELQNANNRYRAAEQRLSAVVGMPELDLSSVQGELHEDVPELSWDATLEAILMQSPELGQAQAAIERARWTVSRECAGRLPDISSEAAVQYDNATENTIATVSVGAALPLFNRNQGNIRRAQAELVAAETELRRLELKLRDRLAVAFQRYSNARQQADKYAQSVLPSAQESLELVTKGYRQGEFPYLDLLNAQRTYFRVNLAYLESLRELRTSVVAIDGLLLSGGLESDTSSAEGSDGAGAR